jgi:glycogen debranching enzyme
LKFALAEADTADQALANARAALDRFDEALALRQSEAQAMYRAEVSQHQDLYQSALQNLLWNEMFYAYDGSFEPTWQGTINFRHVLIMPDKWEFPWLAGWDTGFQAVAAIHADPNLAKQQLRLILGDGWQTPTGHVPCTEWSLITECPPVFAWAARQIFQADGDKDFVAEVFPRLEQLFTYRTKAIQVRQQQLSAGGFMGMDNIPRGAEGSPQADASAWMAWFARDMAELAAELGKADRAEYYRAQVNAIAQAINDRLWDPDTKFYYDCADKDCTSLLKVKSLTGLIPLIAGVVPPDRLEEVMVHLTNEKEFWSHSGVRSLSADESIYEPGYSQSGFKNSNWRGPIWIPINYLLVQTLNGIDPKVSDQLRANLIKTVEDQWRADGRFHEYYDAETGAGLGADHQTGWTALIANLIYEKYAQP